MRRRAGRLFAGPTIGIPNLVDLRVGDIIDSVCTIDGVARIAGLSSRFFLHGLRLPVPPSSTTPGEAGESSSLYSLTGQQVAMTATTPLPSDTTVSVSLTNPKETTWINFKEGTSHLQLADVPGLNLVLDQHAVSRINNLMTIQLNPDTSPLPPSALPMYRDAPLTFTLKTEMKWQYPGKLVLSIGSPVNQRTPSLLYGRSPMCSWTAQDAAGADLDWI